jgi:AraC family transcriptional regulator
MQLYIKNMVCDRCVTAVRQLLQTQHLHPKAIQLGEVSLEETALSPEALASLGAALTGMGFELMDDRRSRLIEKIKNTLIRLVHYSGEPPRLKYSEIISAELGQDYPFLSKLFREVEGITIEQYLLRQKTEKVKEFLVYDELTLSEIAGRMGYSSVAHLSGQFRKLTGMSPTEFKKLTHKQRSPLDQVGREGAIRR